MFFPFLQVPQPGGLAGACFAFLPQSAIIPQTDV
jgi:hypothetical protein